MPNIDFPQIAKLNEPNIDSLPPVFTKIALRVKSFVRSLGKSDLHEGIVSLSSLYSQVRAPNIDYEHLAAHFAYEYFIENFWKASCVFLKAPPPLSHSVIDMGCGSGATLLAYLAALDHSLAGSTWKIKVLLIDRSEAQLNLACKILNAVHGDFEHLEIFSQRECADIMEKVEQHRFSDSECAEFVDSSKYGLFLESECADFIENSKYGPAGALLLGHVLTENAGQIDHFLRRAIDTVDDDGRIYIIERADDLAWEEIDESARQLALYSKSGTISLRTKKIDSDGSKRLASRSNLSARYLQIHLPPNKKLALLLHLYFKAWRTQSTELLKKIFAPDAKYHEKPHRSPLDGLEQIERYWNEKVRQQRCLDVRILRTAYTQREAFAEWTAEFKMLGERVSVTGVLILVVGLDENRVTSLHEYFRTVTSLE
ncbi:MAG: nuclear transport factor 2 family protein [Acidobacteriota bacterium]